MRPANSKLLVIATFVIIFSGLGFLWFGIGNYSQPDIQTPKVENSPQAVAKVQPISTTSAFLGTEGERHYVSKVIDGDTFEIENGQKVRMIGIDTPETKDPRRPVGCFGKQASTETKKLIEGKEVILQKDVSETDKYKRLLRYVYLPLEDKKLLFINDYLVREGFAKVLTYPPDVKFNQQFLEAQIEAREAKKGLWGSC